MKIKICGLRLLEDARLALELGATHLGVVLAENSPRCATIDEARAILALTDSIAEGVLVFRDQSVSDVLRAARAAHARCVQVHGADLHSIDVLRAHGLRVMPVASCAADAHALPNLPVSPTVTEPGILDCGRGGSGERFPWHLLGARAPDHVFIAGGIDPTNVDFLLAHRPYGIDLSRGVEVAAGVKDPRKLRALFDRLRNHSEGSPA
ncbi:MAG: phosphoribosylanthranilate isomerase [Planctomycetota bacterium]